MEKQNGILGLSNKFWGIVGLVTVAGSAMLICAFILLAFGVDIGGGIE